MMLTYNGPRFGKDADLERNGTPITVAPCQCITCRDMGAWLTEPHHIVTFVADCMSRGHVPARWVKDSGASMYQELPSTH